MNLWNLFYQVSSATDISSQDSNKRGQQEILLSSLLTDEEGLDLIMMLCTQRNHVLLYQ